MLQQKSNSMFFPYKAEIVNMFTTKKLKTI